MASLLDLLNDVLPSIAKWRGDDVLWSSNKAADGTVTNVWSQGVAPTATTDVFLPANVSHAELTTAITAHDVTFGGIATAQFLTADKAFTAHDVVLGAGDALDLKGASTVQDLYGLPSSHIIVESGLTVNGNIDGSRVDVAAGALVAVAGHARGTEFDFDAPAATTTTGTAAAAAAAAKAAVAAQPAVQAPHATLAADSWTAWDKLVFNTASQVDLTGGDAKTSAMLQSFATATFIEKAAGANGLVSGEIRFADKSGHTVYDLHNVGGSLSAIAGSHFAGLAVTMPDGIAKALAS